MTVNGVLIKENERLDDLHRNGFKLIQSPSGFCFGLDAVMLSAFVKVGKNEKVLDLCTGSGVVPILTLAKTRGRNFSGIELLEENADMAARSVKLNNLESFIEIICGDVKNITDYYAPGSFDAVTANPPYLKAGGGATNQISAKTAARHEIFCDLNDIARAASKVLRFGGRLYLVHRPHRLAEIFAALAENNLQPKEMRFVHTFADKPPELVLIGARKGGGAFLNVLPPLMVYEAEGIYTKETFDIYYS